MRMLNVGGRRKSIALPPHFQDWEHLLLDIDPRDGADLVCDARALRSNGFGEIYFAPPLIALELHAFALKTQAEPGLPALHYLLGYARPELDQHDSALQAFARCLDLQPKQPLFGETLKQQTPCRARIDLARGPSRGG